MAWFGYFLAIQLLWSCSDASDKPTAAAVCAPAEASSWDKDIGQIFIGQCGSCHPGTQQTNYRTYPTVVQNITGELARIMDNSMPEGGLPQTSKDLINAWVKAGTPEKSCN